MRSCALRGRGVGGAHFRRIAALARPRSSHDAHALLACTSCARTSIRRMQRVLRNRRVTTAVAAAVVGVLLGGCAVVPSYTAHDSTFEGFPVISSVPAHPS